jgi:hypothetical protein
VPRDCLQDAACDLPFKIAAPWIPYLRFYVDFAGVGDVGGQPHTRKSRLREFTLSLVAFNLRMQALRPLQLSKQFQCSATLVVCPSGFEFLRGPRIIDAFVLSQHNFGHAQRPPCDNLLTISVLGKRASI